MALGPRAYRHVSSRDPNKFPPALAGVGNNLINQISLVRVVVRAQL